MDTESQEDSREKSDNVDHHLGSRQRKFAVHFPNLHEKNKTKPKHSIGRTLKPSFRD